MMNIVENIQSQENTSGIDDQGWYKLKSLQHNFVTLSKCIDESIEAEKEMRKLLPQTRIDMEKLRKLTIEIMELKHLAPMINDTPPPNDVHQHQRIEQDMEDENKHVQLMPYIAKAG